MRLIDQKLLTNIFIPPSPVTPRKTPIIEAQAGGVKENEKQEKNEDFWDFLSHLAHLDFYCEAAV